ncbi:MAG: putative manganese-dependent inorganic diphosphatase [Spirochaetales bacterium]|nr:putative manganese-dependent inorganic diphosphatase [Spirochaetales bacterium]
MRKVYITGHRNPDIDSICSAYAYAQLKRILDPSSEYIPVRCGHLSDSVRSQLEFIGFEPQSYMRDVHPKVSDVMRKPDIVLDADSPIYNLVNVYSMKQSSVIPVTDKGRFLGLLSVDDITAWFLEDNSATVPVYDFTVRNIASVIPGRVLKKGESDEFKANLIAGAADLEGFKTFVRPNSPSMLVMGFRKDLLEYAMSMQIPAIIITASESVEDLDLSGYRGLVYSTRLGTAEAMRRLRMAEPVRRIMGTQGRNLQVTDLFDDAKEMLASSSLRGLPVFDGDRWVGYVTRRCFLSKPQYNVILVDHNEASQSIKGVEESNILEVIDHHRVNAPKTKTPVLFDIEPLGSTCTIVHQMYLRNGLIPDSLTSKVLLTGVICDTLMLKSPTTTAIDVTSAGQLASMCGVDDIAAFGQSLFSKSESLSTRDPATVIGSDFKSYTENGQNIGVGQCEVPTLADLDDYRDVYLEKLAEKARSGGYAWTLLMVTDVLHGNSVLLTSPSKYEKKLSYVELHDHVFDMPGVLSRKMQLLPEILHAMG